MVGETNDFRVNNQKAAPVTDKHVVEAITNAASGPVAEGSVGAGTGTQAFGWKGGIGTSSRVLPDSLGGFTVGILVQTNFGGVLSIAGAPVGRELGQYSYRGDVEPAAQSDGQEDGSIMIVLATDAPVSVHNLQRLAKRSIMGLARTGSFASNGSGDYVIAFSTSEDVRTARDADSSVPVSALLNSSMSPLFAAATEATEEAIYNAIFKATTVSSSRGTLEAIPIDDLTRVLSKYNVLESR